MRNTIKITILLVLTILFGLWLLCNMAQATVVYPAQKYATQTTIYFVVYDSNSPWRNYETAPAVADVHVFQNGASEARADNSVTDLGRSFSLVLSATEMTAAYVTVDINDASAPPLFGDETIIIPTFGNASAAYAFDLSSATVTTGAISEGAITATAIAQNAIGADEIAASAIGASELATGAFTSDELATTFIDELENDPINSNNTRNSLAWYIKRGGGGYQTSIYDGTVSSATSNTLVMAAGSSATNDIYNGNMLAITGGVGVGQTRIIVDYIGSSRTATVDKNWSTTPTAGATFSILASAGSYYSDEGTAQDANDGTDPNIQLATTASATDDIYVNSWLTILSGTGSGQTRLIDDYDGTGKWAFVSTDWATKPDTTSVYAVIPNGTQASDIVPPDPGLSIEDVMTALTSQGYTSALATNIGTTNSRIGDPCSAGDTLAGDLLAIEGMVDSLEARLTSTRAGYLDTINDWADGQRLDLILDNTLTAATAAQTAGEKLDTADELRTLLTGGTTALVTTANLPTNFGSLDINASGQVDIYQIENTDATTQLGTVTVTIDAADLLDALLAGHTNAGSVGQAISLIPALR